MTFSDPNQIANLAQRVKAAQLSAQNLVSGSFTASSPQSRQSFMLGYLRLHDEVEQLLHDARVPITGLEQLQTTRHRSLVAEQVPPNSLYREIAGETAIIGRILDDLLDTLAPPPQPSTITTATGISFLSEAGKRYTYQTTQLLGTGRFSRVYRGTDQAGAPVAIKRLEIRGDSTRHQAIDTQQTGRELLVARQLATVSTSHIMPTLDAGRSDSELHLVMPLADHSLADAIRERGPMPAPKVKELLRQMASALQELASASVMHRDIKPGNILWHEGRWCLADFGISRITSELTATYTFRGTGTLEYLAPEAWNFGPQTVASDLYALGCVGYEAVTGRKAFDGDDLGQLHATHTPVLPADTDPALARIISLLLAKHPDQRPPDARRVLELLAVREDLTDGQRALQHLSAAAAQRAVQRGSQDAALIQRHEHEQRARIALGALWRDLVDEVRQALPDAQAADEEPNRTLTIGDTRLRIRVADASPQPPGQVLLTAEVFLNRVAAVQPHLAASLVCLWQNERPEWHLAQFRLNEIRELDVFDLDGGISGLPTGRIHRAWDLPDSDEAKALESLVRADAAAVIDLIARETRNTD